MLAVAGSLGALVFAALLFGLAANARSRARSLKSEVGGPYRRYEFKSPDEAAAFARVTGRLRLLSRVYVAAAVVAVAIAIAIVVAQAMLPRA